MITTDKQLQSTREALLEVEAAMAALNQRKQGIHPDRFALMAEPIVDEIRKLRALIDAYTGMAAATLAEAPLWLRLQGEHLDIEDAPTSVITAMIDILRVGVQAVAEYMQRGALGGRPTAQLREACDLRLVSWVPGSVQLGLRLPDFPTASIDDENDPREQARLALQAYVQAACWTGSEADVGALEQSFPDEQQRLLVLNQVARLIPRPRGGLECVELSGRAVPTGAVRLRREARERITEAIEHTVREEKQKAEGILREIDLDARTFTIRVFDDGAPEIRCQIAETDDGLLDIAKAALDYRVAVVGTRKRDPTKRRAVPLEIREIVILGRDNDDKD